VFEDGFFEGAWDGDFAQAGFDQSANVFGSGAKIGGSAITFVPPSHTLESLVQFAGGGLSVVSNSLAFLSAFCNFDLHPIDWRLGERFASITQGLDNAVQRLRFRNGLLTIYYHHNFIAAKGMELRTIAKPLPPRFEDFSSYRTYLLNTARQVCANAWHHARLCQYELLTTLSSGYDSAAAAVIAASLGCREALTLKHAQRGLADSGAEVAKVLGLSLREFERVDQVPNADLSLAEFVSTGTQGEDYIYRAFQDFLPGKVLFTGFMGDVIWEDGIYPTEKLHRKDLSGASLGEFRLARNFVHLSVPCIGCLRHADIHRISHSAEMAPYSIGGRYDRPIPRRIVESAGVPRALFGQKKLAASLIFYRNTALMSRKGHSDVMAFGKRLGLSWRERAYGVVFRMRWAAGLALFHQFRRVARLRGGRVRAVKALRPIAQTGLTFLARALGPYEVFEHGNPQNAILHRWALSRIKPRYASVTRRAACNAGEYELGLPADSHPTAR
jgi:hypothetical protein